VVNSWMDPGKFEIVFVISLLFRYLGDSRRGEKVLSHKMCSVSLCNVYSKHFLVDKYLARYEQKSMQGRR
jgi:hypothetical protein